MKHKLSARDFGVLHDVVCFDSTTTTGWGKPMMVGGTDASHHSATMSKLARIGLLERREAGGGIFRRAWEYRATQHGRAFTKQVLDARKRKANR